MTLKKRSWSWVKAAIIPLLETQRGCAQASLWFTWAFWSMMSSIMAPDILLRGRLLCFTDTRLNLHECSSSYMDSSSNIDFWFILLVVKKKKKAAHLNEKVRLFQAYLGSNLMMWLQNHAKDHGKTDSSCPEKFPVGNFTSAHLRETYEKMR